MLVNVNFTFCAVENGLKGRSATKYAGNRTARNFMATITTEFGKVSSKKQRAVYLRVRDKKTEKRILTGIKVDESEISLKTKRIKNFEKA